MFQQPGPNSHCSLVPGSDSAAAALSGLQYLNLHGNSIRRIEHLDSCRSLRVLLLSFNEISKIEGLDHLQHLNRLDLGFNSIKRIEGLAGCGALRSLTLCNNLVSRLEDLNVLKKQVPGLTSLSLLNNSVRDAKSYR